MKEPLTNNLTLVFTIKDHSAFEPERQRLMESFTRTAGKPYSITALSLGHEIYRLELIEAAAEIRDWDLLDDIFGLVNPAEYQILDGRLVKND